MSVFLSPIGGAGAQFFDNNGVPLAGGKIYTYAAGTTTPAGTYTSSAGNIYHTNPIILDAAGRVPADGEIWVSSNLAYKFVLKDSTDVLIATWDNILGINSPLLNYVIEEEIQTATASQTVFNLSTITYNPGTYNLSVFVNGINQYVGLNYTETNANTVTFTSGVTLGAKVKFTTAVMISGATTTASAVSYTPYGANAITRNVQGKLREFVSVKDFGAKGDGATNDTVAINNALASSSTAYVYFPAGTYVHSGITVSNATEVVMWGQNATLYLANSSNTKCIYADTCGFFEIDGFVVNGNSANQTITGTRLNGAGIQTQGCTVTKISNNTIKNVSTGASIAVGSANPFDPVDTAETAMIINNIIQDSGFAGAPFTCDAIYCQLDNSLIAGNFIKNGTDYGVALEYSVRSRIINNSIHNVEVGIGMVGCDTCVIADNALTSSLFKGIFLSTGGQPVQSPWISYHSVIANNTLDGIGGSSLIGDSHGIFIAYSGVTVSMVVSNNIIRGGNYGIGITANGCLVSNNIVKEPVIRGILTDNTSFTTLSNNIVSAGSLPNYEIAKIGSVFDYAQANIQSRVYTGTTTVAGASYRACYIKTDDKTGNHQAVVNLTVTGDVSGTGPCAAFRQLRIRSVAGTITITDMLPYSGDTANIVVTAGATGTAGNQNAEVLAGAVGTTATVSVFVQLVSMDGSNPFYISEA